MFQASFEVAQQQLGGLRVSMVDALQESVVLYPLFDEAGRTEAILVDTAGRRRRHAAFDPGQLFVAREFPMEIRVGKAIYARPMSEFQPASSLAPDEIDGLWLMDPWRRIPRHSDIDQEIARVLREHDLASLRIGDERVEDVFFSLDLRRVTGALGKRGLFRRRRIELPELSRLLAVPV